MSEYDVAELRSRIAALEAQVGALLTLAGRPAPSTQRYDGESVTSAIHRHRLSWRGRGTTRYCVHPDDFARLRAEEDATDPDPARSREGPIRFCSVPVVPDESLYPGVIKTRWELTDE
jgi:hypothetical protein